MSRSILYVHDLLFIQCDEGCFSASFTDEYFERFFLAGFDRIDIFSRVEKSKSPPVGYNFIKSSSVFILNYLGSSYKNVFKPSVARSLLKMVKNADVVVLSTPSINGMYVSFLCLLLNKKYVCEVAGDYTAYSTKRYGKLFTLFLKFYMPWLIKKSIGATYVTNDLARRYPNQYSFVGSNVNIRKLYPRSSYMLKSSQNVCVGFVGGLIERKGLRVIIQAAHILKNKYKNFNFIFNIVGGHDDQDWLLICAEYDVIDSFIFHGMKSRSEIDSLFDEFDVYIQPSFSEGVPRASIEAMSHGLPVIATDLPGFLEILSVDLLIPPGRPDLLAEKIYKLSQSEQLRNEVGMRNLKKSSDFLFEKINEKRVEFYKGVLRRLKSFNGVAL